MKRLIIFLLLAVCAVAFANPVLRGVLGKKRNAGGGGPSNPYGTNLVIQYITTGPDTFTLTCEDTGTYTGQYWCIDTSDDSVVQSNSFAAFDEIIVTNSGAGTYNLYVNGVVPHIYFNNGANDKGLLRKILNIGDTDSTSYNNAFYGCAGITEITIGTGSGSPNTVDMTGMFQDVDDPTTLTFSGSSFKASSVSQLCYGMDSLLDVDLSAIDVSEATSVRHVAGICAALTNMVIDTWVVTNCTDFRTMCNQSTLDSTSYNNLLIVLDSQTPALDPTVPSVWSADSGVEMKFGGSVATGAGLTARASLISSSIDITDGTP